MALRIYNTMTRRKEDFKPLQAGRVGIYVCGITAYDYCHAGHARSAVVFDVITRYLRYRGYEVTYVKNFTDLDDKIIARSQAENCAFSEIADRFIEACNEDMDALGVLRPDLAPRATEHIDDMLHLIGQLIDKGIAYTADGDVYFAVDGFPDYGKLSGRNLADMMAGARVDVSESKRNPFDFALWKAGKEGEPWWESPWGRGRPGWHIECSCMSQRFLGDTFDIHGGGEDLIFPHHENEIAQSEGATGKPFANCWIHNGFVRINDEKMSKSLGNIFTIRDLLKNYHPEVIRFFMLSSHYRSPVDFSDVQLAEARLAMERFYTTLKALKEGLAGGPDLSGVAADRLEGREGDLWKRIVALPRKFIEAMDDDFNTPRALAALFESVRSVNAFLADRKGPCSPEALFVMSEAERALRDIGCVLGLFQEDPDVYFQKELVHEAGKRGIDISAIEELIEERWQARKTKNWKRADEIRAVLSEKGITLKDGPAGTTWKID
ncbi:MAG: cysteine--tRNA ligase [Deltaproteobacteria bacterium]|nr:cysteine--tRNA ligase [Deltaproteobacteria bacterium]